MGKGEGTAFPQGTTAVAPHNPGVPMCVRVFQARACDKQGPLRAAVVVVNQRGETGVLRALPSCWRPRRYHSRGWFSPTPPTPILGLIFLPLYMPGDLLLHVSFTWLVLGVCVCVRARAVLECSYLETL